MTAQEIIEKAKDTNVSDQEVLELLKPYLADEYDDGGNIVPPTTEKLHEIDQLREIVGRLRPGVMEMIIKLVIEQHGQCCCKDLD